MKFIPGSVESLGAMFGIGFASYSTAAWGRKFSMLIGNILSLVSWIGIALIPNPEGILAARYFL